MGSIGSIARSALDLGTFGNTERLIGGERLEQAGMGRGAVRVDNILGGKKADTSALDAAAATAAGQQRIAAEELARIKEGQQTFADQLIARANGTGPSLVNAQLQQAQDRSLAQQLAASRGARGASAGLRQRQLMQNQAMGAQQMGANAAAARIAEQQQAQNAFQSYLSSQQGYNAGLLGANSDAARAQAALSQRQAESDNALTGNIVRTGAGLAGTFFGGPAGGAAASTAAGALTGGGGVNPGLGSAPMAKIGTAVPGAQKAPWFTKGDVSYAAKGGKVPGKPNVKGDNIENDVVPAMLSPGEIVVPRTVAEKGPEAVAKFAKNAKEIKTFGEALCGGGKVMANQGGKVPFELAMKQRYEKPNFDSVKMPKDDGETELETYPPNKPGTNNKFANAPTDFAEMLKAKYGKKA